MDHITIRITDDAYHGDLSRSRVVQFDVDLSTPANDARPLPVHGALSSSAEPLPTLGESSELARLRTRCDGLEAALIRRQSGPRFDYLSATFEVLTGDAARDWVYVRDNINQLIWARTLKAGRLDHENATKAVGELGSGWRLPTRTELLTLVDDTTHEPATFDPFRDDTALSWYWTSTIAAWSSSAAWVVYFFSGGGAGSGHRGFTCFVRAVRSVSAPPAGQVVGSLRILP